MLCVFVAPRSPDAAWTAARTALNAKIGNETGNSSKSGNNNSGVGARVLLCHTSRGGDSQAAALADGAQLLHVPLCGPGLPSFFYLFISTNTF